MSSKVEHFKALLGISFCWLLHTPLSLKYANKFNLVREWYNMLICNFLATAKYLEERQDLLELARPFEREKNAKPIRLA